MNTIRITPADAAACEATFIPVLVDRGRKFRGEAFSLGEEPTVSSCGYRWTAFSQRLWDPETKRYVYANPEFVGQRMMTDADILEAKRQWIESEINGTVDWCRSKSAADTAEDEILRFAANVLRKRNSWLAVVLTRLNTNDSRDVETEVRKTVEWAKSLRTRPGWVYNKYCAGGKPYSPRKVSDIAHQALINKKIACRPEFPEIWLKVCDENCLPY